MQYREAERLVKKIDKLNLTTLARAEVVECFGNHGIDVEVGEYDAPMRFEAWTKEDGERVLARLTKDAAKL